MRKRLSVLLLAILVLGLTGALCWHRVFGSGAFFGAQRDSDWVVERFTGARARLPRAGRLPDPHLPCANIYLLYHKNSKQGVIIDPGAKNTNMEEVIQKRGIKVQAILNTHCHLNHAGGNGFYRAIYDVDVYAHSGDRPFYRNPLSLRVQ
jgi:glyoxylase-like metal-dependent hydrolase (beta-lactamase superfamily II)